MKKYSIELIKTCMALFVLIPFVIGALVFSKSMFQAIIIIIAIGMLIEWYDMTKTSGCFVNLGLVIIPIPIASLIIITMLFPDYRYIFLTYFAILWSVDSAAMFGGKALGGPKLAKIISPNKTWSGLIIGMFASSVIIRAMEFIPEYDFVYTGYELSIFGAAMGFIAQMSDLFVSIFKRRFNLKDTGSIIPGHGGILDRCDSWILTAPILLYIVS